MTLFFYNLFFIDSYPDYHGNVSNVTSIVYGSFVAAMRDAFSALLKWDAEHEEVTSIFGYFLKHIHVLSLKKIKKPLDPSQLSFPPTILNPGP